MFFTEIKQKAKQALDYVQANPILDAVARGAMETFPAGQILLKFYDKYAEINTEDAASDIARSLKLITEMNEEQFDNFAESLEENKQEILENRKMLTILTKNTAKTLGLLQDLKEGQNEQLARIEAIQKEMCTLLQQQNIPTQIDPDVYLKLTKEFKDKIKQLEEEKSKLQEELKKAGEKPKMDVDLLLRESNFHFNEKDFEKTIVFADAVIVYDPNNFKAWFNKGYALDMQKRYADATASWDKALELKPDDQDTLNNRGKSLNELGRYEEALKDLDKAIKLKPD